MADSSDRAGFDPAAVIAGGRVARSSAVRRRQRAAFAVSGGVCLAWSAGVTAAGLWGRVSDHGVAAATMVVGSFVAGATPQGGGAVAFPVFTKGLEIPSATARTFSLCIQSIGMSTAAISIVLRRSAVEWRAVGVGVGTGIVGFLLALWALADWDEPFAPMRIPGPYVKVTFSLIVLAMTAATIVGLRSPIRSVTDQLPNAGPRTWTLLAAFGVAGGVAAALLGSGADVMIYLFLVVILGVRSTVGVPTSVVTMALLSLVGAAVFAGLDRQFSTTFAADGSVLAVGGEALDAPAAPRQADVFGMWLAAVPIVAWGAPLGALVASRLRSTDLARVVVALGATEVLTTIVFVPELRSDLALAAFGVVGAIVGVAGVVGLAARLRHGSGDAGSLTITRDSVEVSEGYRKEIHGRDR